MTNQHSKWTSCLLLVCLLCLGSSVLMSSGCKKKSRPRATPLTRQRQKSDVSFLVTALASALNNLPSEVVLNLQPPVPMLDDSKSADGQPVLAACGPTPGLPNGPNNYLLIPGGNGNFRSAGIKAGDIVRYFIKVDEESREHGIEQIGYFELVVRRVDIQNPENGLVFEGGLIAPVEFPARIEIWRFSSQRMQEINRRLNSYQIAPERLIGWEPTADESALTQLLEQTNQWLRNQKDPKSDWQPVPLMAKIPAKLRNMQPLAHLISTATIESGPFDPTEARQLQQAIWLRDISIWAKGDTFSPVEVAEALFDWTVRNIQLDHAQSTNNIYQPWQALMYGHGTAQQRAWVFAELCRQQQLDVVMLTAGEKWWLPALLHEGQLYLFDTQLGLPLYGVDPDSVATLAELKDNPTLLRNLDLESPAFTYPITAKDLEQITAELVATPLQVSQRSHLLERAFKGDDFVVLAANTRQLADSLEKQPQVQQTRMWLLPFKSILAEQAITEEQRIRASTLFGVFASRPRLWKARILHFQGDKPVPLDQRNDPLVQPNLGHQQATALYQHSKIRPSNKRLAYYPPTERMLSTISKNNASYWLGLLSYDLGNYRVAKDWFANRTLAPWPNGPWTTGASYNLARTLEALGETGTASDLLKIIQSPQRHGNLLRARRLAAGESNAEEASEEKSNEEESGKEDPNE